MEKETDTATWKCFSFRLTKSGEFPHPPEPQRSSEHLAAAVGNKITKLSFLPAARFARQDFFDDLPSSKTESERKLIWRSRKQGENEVRSLL